MAKQSMSKKSNPVIAMLKADHKKVKALFSEYGEAEAQRQRTSAQKVISTHSIATIRRKRLVP
jgi:hypothetical protein